MPKDLVDEYLETLFWGTPEELEKRLGKEICLLREILARRGVKFLITDVDRWTTGKPWAPTPQLCELAAEDSRILVLRKYPECLCCGKGQATISAVCKGQTVDQDDGQILESQPLWTVNIEGTTFSVYPVFHDLTGAFEGAQDFYAPLCPHCNDKIRPEMNSADWGEISWPFAVSLEKLKPPPLPRELATHIKMVESADFWSFLPQPAVELSREDYEQLKNSLPEPAQLELPEYEDYQTAWQYYNNGTAPSVYFVDGTLGSGKTSLGENAAIALGAEFLQEFTKEEWGVFFEMLEPFYELLLKFFNRELKEETRELEELRRLQNELQIYGLAKSLNHIVRALNSVEKKQVVIDVSLLGNTVYEISQRMLGIVSDENFRNYQRLMASFWQALPRIGAYIYNGTYSPRTIQRRSEKRGRVIEEGLDLDYLRLLNFNCFNLMGELEGAGIRLLPIDSETAYVSEENPHEAEYFILGIARALTAPGEQ